MNPFYNSHKQNQNGQNNSLSLNDMLAGVMNRMVPPGMTPEQVVRQMIDSGRMTQDQFEQYSKIADQLTGRKR